MNWLERKDLARFRICFFLYVCRLKKKSVINISQLTCIWLLDDVFLLIFVAFFLIFTRSTLYHMYVQKYVCLFTIHWTKHSVYMRIIKLLLDWVEKAFVVYMSECVYVLCLCVFNTRGLCKSAVKCFTQCSIVIICVSRFPHSFRSRLRLVPENAYSGIHYYYIARKYKLNT